MSQPRVLQVIDSLNIGGAERVLINLTNLLVKHNVEVSVVQLLKRGVLTDGLDSKVKCFVLKRASRFGPVSLFRFVRLAVQFDIIHVHMRHNFLYVGLALCLVPSGKKIILHDHYNVYPETGLRFWILKKLLRRQYFISVEGKGVDWALHQLQLSKDQVFLLQNTIKREDFNSGNLPDTERKQNIVLVSNIKPSKNIMFILELWRQLKERRLEMHLQIIGVVQDPLYYKSVLRFIDDHSLKSLVSVDTGVTHVQEKLSQYVLGLHASAAETGPLVLLEYLAQGLPFLAFRTGQIAEKINLRFEEFIIDTFDQNAWITRIQSLLSVTHDPQELKNYFEDHFGEKHYIEKCLEIYQKVSDS